MSAEPTTALRVAQRAALALGLSDIEKTLQELAGKSTSIAAITNDDGYQQCHSARMALKNQRVEIEKKGKAARDALHNMPCLACVKEAEFSRKRGETPLEQPFPTECHHIVDRGYRKHSGGHMASIPLESWHHRGICIDYLTARQMTKLYGPSLALQKKSFIAQYGDERSLLEEVDQKLKTVLTEALTP